MAEASTTVDEAQVWYASDGTALIHNDVEGLVDDASSIEWQELLSAKASEQELAAWNLTEDAMTVLIGAADDSHACPAAAWFAPLPRPLYPTCWPPIPPTCA